MRLKMAAVAVLALIVVCLGCGGTRGSGGETSTASARSGASGMASTHAKAVKFAECMRANGLGAFPDPDAKGGLTIDAVANGSSVDTNATVFKHALSACKDLEPPGFTGRQRSLRERKAALEFAQCVRDNGVSDFPDPGENEPLVDTTRIPSANRAGGMTILNAAMRACGRYAAAAGVRASK